MRGTFPEKSKWAYDPRIAYYLEETQFQFLSFDFSEKFASPSPQPLPAYLLSQLCDSVVAK